MMLPRSPMLALLWKDWRQLRHLRWACTALGALLPVFFVAGAELGRQGLSPFGRGGSYSMSSMLRDAVPGALAFAIWPLAALLFVAQTFAGERAAGTEGFLLERPVPRGRIWTARLAASVLSILAVMCLTGGLWAVEYLSLGDPGSLGWQSSLSMLGIGVAIVLVATMCGTLAASLLSSPLLAIFATALLAAVPAVSSSALVFVFPYARWGSLPLGLFVPWLLVPLYLMASLIVCATGEPAGRGRLARGFGSIGFSVLATAFIFMSAVQAALRHESIRPEPMGFLDPAMSGDRALVESAGVWLVDTKKAQVLEHYPMPCREAVWRPDGEMFALATCSGPLGSRGRCRVSFFDRQGKPAALPWLDPGDGEGAFRLVWSRDRVVFLTQEHGRSDVIVVFEPGRGETARIKVAGTMRSTDFVGTLWDGTLAIARLLPVEKPESPGSLLEVAVHGAYGLYRVDPESGDFDPHPLIEEKGSLWGARDRLLSPSGRWWRHDRPHAEPQEMVDLTTGRTVPATKGGWPDDTIRIFLEQDGDGTSLIETAADGSSRTLRSWTGRQAQMSRSPGGRYILVELGDDPPALAIWIHDIEMGAWREIPVPSPTGGDLTSRAQGMDSLRCQWAGPTTLAIKRNDSLAFEDVDAPGNLRYVIGGP